MALTIPSSWTVLKPFTIGDKAYENGDEVSAEELARVPHVSALMSAGYLVPDTDPFFRKTSVPAHIPTVLPPSALTVASAPVEESEPKAKPRKRAAKAESEDA